MDLELARDRVTRARVGRLGTVTAEGRAHLVPCCFAMIGGVAYTAVDAKPKSTLDLRRVRNVVDRGSACLLVDHYDEDWSSLWWVRLDASARIVKTRSEIDEALAALAGKYHQYAVLPIPGPVIALEIQRWTAWP